MKQQYKKMISSNLKKKFLIFSSLFIFSTIYAQENLPATWMKGHNQVSQPGTYGTINVAAETNAPGARYGAASITLKNGKLLLFAGQGFGPTTSGGLNDLWLFDPATNQWTWIKGASATNQASNYGTRKTEAATNAPGGRRTFAYATDANGKLWIFGGLGYGLPGTGSTYQNDLWQYDPASNNWTWIKGNNENGVFANYGTQGVSASTNMPGGRYGGLSWIDKAGNFWLFGGYGYTTSGGAGYLNDLWKYDIQKDEWVWMKGSNTLSPRAEYGTKNMAAAANTPGGRYGGGNYWSDAAGNFYLFGGYGYTSIIGYMNDLWKFDPISNNWTWLNGSQLTNESTEGVYGNKGIAADENTPGGRRYPTVWKDTSDNIWLAAGYGYSATGGNEGALNDVWKYNAKNNQWAWIHYDSTLNQYGLYGTKEIASNTNKPGGRIGTASWIDLQGNIWWFGGQGFAQSTGSVFLNLNDLWKLALNMPPLIDSVDVQTSNNIPAIIHTHAGSLQLQATVFPATVNQAVEWSVVPVTGSASISNNAVLTAGSNGTVWVYATAVGDHSKKDSILVTIAGQAIAGKPELILYPNPTINDIYLKIEQLHPAFSINIFDNAGRRVYTEQVAANSIVLPHRINTNKLSAGLYVIEIKGKGMEIVKRFNKM